MRVSRFLMAAGLAVLVGVGSVAILSAQAKTDEDYDKLMKGVGAANGAMREGRRCRRPPAPKPRSWWRCSRTRSSSGPRATTRKPPNGPASAMTHAAEIAEGRDGRQRRRRWRAHQKELGGTCQTCHTKYREKTETGFVIKKG